MSPIASRTLNMESYRAAAITVSVTLACGPFRQPFPLTGGRAAATMDGHGVVAKCGWVRCCRCIFLHHRTFAPTTAAARCGLAASSEATAARSVVAPSASEPSAAGNTPCVRTFAPRRPRTEHRARGSGRLSRRPRDADVDVDVERAGPDDGRAGHPRTEIPMRFPVCNSRASATGRHRPSSGSRTSEELVFLAIRSGPPSSTRRPAVRGRCAAACISGCSTISAKVWRPIRRKRSRWSARPVTVMPVRSAGRGCRL